MMAAGCASGSGTERAVGNGGRSPDGGKCEACMVVTCYVIAVPLFFCSSPVFHPLLLSSLSPLFSFFLSDELLTPSDYTIFTPLTHSTDPSFIPDSLPTYRLPLSSRVLLPLHLGGRWQVRHKLCSSAGRLPVTTERIFCCSHPRPLKSLLRGPRTVAERRMLFESCHSCCSYLNSAYQK